MEPGIKKDSAPTETPPRVAENEQRSTPYHPLRKRFSKSSLIAVLESRSISQAKHARLDMGTGWAQFVKGADVNSPNWWSRVDAYYRSIIYAEIAREIESGWLP